MRTLEEDALQGVAPDGRAEKSFASAISRSLSCCKLRKVNRA